MNKVIAIIIIIFLFNAAIVWYIDDNKYLKIEKDKVKIVGSENIITYGNFTLAKNSRSKVGDIVYILYKTNNIYDKIDDEPILYIGTEKKW